MPAPVETIPGCPPGLEYLTQIDQLLVHQQVELFEGKDDMRPFAALGLFFLPSDCVHEDI